LNQRPSRYKRDGLPAYCFYMEVKIIQVQLHPYHGLNSYLTFLRVKLILLEKLDSEEEVQEI